MVRRRRLTGWLAIACGLAALTVVAAGCGGGGSSSSGTTTQAAATGSTGAAGGAATGGAATGASTGAAAGGATGTPIKVGLVTDIGGLNDRSFNHLAYVGLQRAQKQLGVQGRVLTSNSNSDYIPNLSSLAQQGYDLVIGVGFLMADAMDTVATKFPDTKFAIIDFSQAALKHKPTNVVGILFKEQESGYLAGYLAGLINKQSGFPKTNGKGVVSTVGGQKIPPVDHYIAGFQAGVKAADPSIKALNAYSQEFVDQAPCKQIAQNQIAQGSDVVFQVAGGCGLGAIDAAKEAGVWAIGVDADQAYVDPKTVLTSAVKKVDVGVYTVIQQAQDGSFKGGDEIFDLNNDGTGLGKINPAVPSSMVDKIKQVEADIKAGKIQIPDTVK